MPNPWSRPDHAAGWSGAVGPKNPLREEQLDVLFEVVAARRPRRILDLGCGPGVIARRLLAHHGDAELVAVDFSEPMLERARRALADCGERARVVGAAFEDDWPSVVGGRFDAMIAVQTLHHLVAAEKRRLFGKVAAMMEPGGLFLISDRVELPDDRLFPYYARLWNRARRLRGFDELGVDFGVEVHRSGLADDGDLPDSLDDQLGWLREAGFDPRDCFWRHANRAVFGGLRGPLGECPGPTTAP